MKRVLFIILFFNISLYIFSERYGTVYTPTGKSVEAIFDKEEYNSSDRQMINAYYISTYPQAIFLESSTKTYNCHAFAWHIWENSTICWINQLKHDRTPNLSTYWTNNGGYRETTASRAEKIFYYLGDHSAVPSPDFDGMYESKWGSGPRMAHAPGYGPYTSMDKREYFERNIVQNPVTPTVENELLICSNGNGPTWVNETFNYSSPTSWPDNYSSTWRIETTKGDSVIGTKATISNQSVNSANINFNSLGLFEIYLTGYNTNGEIVGQYWFEAAVEVFDVDC